MDRNVSIDLKSKMVYFRKQKRKSEQAEGRLEMGSWEIPKTGGRGFTVIIYFFFSF